METEHIEEENLYKPSEHLTDRCRKVYNIFSPFYHFSPVCTLLPNKLIKDLNNKK